MRTGSALAAHRSRACGFTFVVVLVMIALVGAGLAASGTVWLTHSQREREEELLFVGQQFRGAIESYVKRSPGAPEFPRKLEDLVEDRRLPTPVRHLRKVFLDPMTGTRDWGFVRQGDRIVGVHSRSQGAPFKRTGFPGTDTSFEAARSYEEWKFVYTANTQANPQVAGTAMPSPGNDTAAPITALPSPPGNTLPVPVPEAAPPPPPPRQDPDASRCETQRRDDNAACQSARSSLSTAQMLACVRSMNERYAACRSGAPTPALPIR